jgi:hypothetical protein
VLFLLFFRFDKKRLEFSALQLIFLFFLQENELRKALIPFIGVRVSEISYKNSTPPSSATWFFSCSIAPYGNENPA